MPPPDHPSRRSNARKFDGPGKLPLIATLIDSDERGNRARFLPVIFPSVTETKLMVRMIDLCVTRLASLRIRFLFLERLFSPDSYADYANLLRKYCITISEHIYPVHT